MKNLRVNILRGREKVGENLIEISDKKTKILLECGEALEPTEKSKLIETQVLNTEYDAIIITHYHADHSALLKNHLKAKKIYISKGAFGVLEYCNAINEENKKRIEFLQDQKTFSIGEITCKPYLCDHSAFDSYMIEIKKEGEKVLYTGDFRSNGRKNYNELLDKLPKKVDLLITEGTKLASKNLTEKEVEEKAVKTFSKYNKVFILQSTLNIDRTVSFYRASKKTGKPFVMGLSCADICSSIKNIPNPITFNDCYTYFNRSVTDDLYVKAKETYKTKLLGRGQISKMEKFTMQINSNMLDYLKKLSEEVSLQDSILVYSMWQGYKPEMQQFLEGVKELGITIVDLHASGHADCTAIKDLILTVNPEEVQFVHADKNCWPLFEKALHRLRIAGQKIIIIDVETNKPYLVEEDENPAKILRIDATKVENGKIGETFCSFVACEEQLEQKTVDLTGITNDMLQGAPAINQVLEKLKEFVNGYDIYSVNSEFVNMFLSYYSKKTGVFIDSVKPQYYDRTSLFLNSKSSVKCYFEFLESGYKYETVYLAEKLLKFANGDC